MLYPPHIRLLELRVVGLPVAPMHFAILFAYISQHAGTDTPFVNTTRVLRNGTLQPGSCTQVLVLFRTIKIMDCV